MPWRPKAIGADLFDEADHDLRGVPEDIHLVAPKYSSDTFVSIKGKATGQ